MNIFDINQKETLLSNILSDIERLHNQKIELLSFQESLKTNKNSFDRFISDCESSKRDYEAEKSKAKRDIILFSDKIYDVAEKTVKHLCQIENILSFGNPSFSQIFNNAKCNYKKENFVEELRTSFDHFKVLFDSVKSNIFSVDARSNINKMAIYYQNILDIKKNINSYISLYIEEECKALFDSYSVEIDKTKKEKASEQDLLVKKIQNNNEEAEKKIKEFLNEEDALRKIKNESLFNYIEDSQEIVLKVPTDLSKAGLYIGTENSTRKIDIKEYQHLSVYKTYLSNSNYKLGISKGKEFVVDLKQPSNICITYEKNIKEDIVKKVVETVCYSILCSYPGFYKQIAAIHEKTIGNDFVNIISNFKKCCDEDKLILSSDQKLGFSYGDNINKTLDLIVDILNNRQIILGESKVNHIIEYNNLNPDNVQPLIFIVIKDLKMKDSYRNYHSVFNEIASKGNKLGIYMIMFNDELTAIENFDKLNESNFQYMFFINSSGELCENGKIYSNNVFKIINNDYYISNKRVKGISLQGIKDQINKVENALDFLEFHQSLKMKPSKEHYTTELQVPIGKHGATPIYMSLRSDNPTSHVIIEGKSGSGKTALLHNIILSACYNYSPKELKIWIFDFMRGGLDFEPYKNLKHVKYISIDNNESDSYDLLSYIDVETNKFKEIKGTNNPRFMVVIDEYHAMSNKCVTKLEVLATQIRKFGGSLVLCSQEAPFTAVNNQVSHRFELYKDSRYSLIENAENYGLKATNRLVLYAESKDSSPKQLRFPFVGNAYYLSNDRVYTNIDETKGIGKVIKTINDKYPNDKCDVTILGEPDKLDFNERLLSNPNQYGKNGSVRVLLGQKDLTKEDMFYKIDNKNRLLLLIGDKTRASSLEYLVSDALTRKYGNKHSVYYINFGTYSANYMSNFRDKYSNNATTKSNEAYDILKKVYDQYLLRKDIIEDDDDVENPLEVIIHCANRSAKVLNSIENTISNKTSKSKTTSYSNDFSSMSDEELLKLAESSLNGFDFSMDKDSTLEIDDYPSPTEIIQILMNADEEYNIHFLIHFEEIEEIEENRIFPQEYSKYKDCIIIPSIPEFDDEPLFENVASTIAKFGRAGIDFSDTYRDKMKITSNNKEQIKNKLRYLIIFDDYVPSLYLPYEYEEGNENE